MRIALFFLVLLPLFASAQNDSTRAIGKLSVQFRSFFMSTINEGSLSDYNALAIGAGFMYESPEIKKFTVGVGAFYTANIFSSDLSEPDPVSKSVNRYEIGLFDVADPDNRFRLYKLEQLYLQYRISNSFFKVGRFLLNTPFINPQDGRMRPTFEQGLWTSIHEIKNLKISAGWITDISPRSTAHWYSVEESIGLYPVGLNENGTRSTYSGKVKTAGIGLIGIDYKKKRTNISFWNTFIENISNTAIIQVEKDVVLAHNVFYGGLQFTRQDGIGEGGNSNETDSYIRKNSRSNIGSVRAGLKNKTWDINLNGTLFSKGDRFLMPREWGRDPFYTFLPRERNEGFGNVKAASVNVTYTPNSSGFKIGVGVGHYELPDVLNYKENKYAMPSYQQLNLDMRYQFKKFLKGGNLQFLYVYKNRTGNDYENVKNVINKVNMSNFNLVFNYQFLHHHSLKK